MNTKVNKAYFLIPVVYTAIIIFLLYMQFSGTKSFSSGIEDILIEGKTHTGAPGKGNIISELSVLSNGLDFSFGEENPLLVLTQDGLTHKTRPEDYRITASGVDIRLSKDILVSFYHMQNDMNTLHISISAADAESIKYLTLPVSGENTVLEAMSGIPVVSVKTESSGNFFLSLPGSASYNADENSIIIYPETGAASELVLERTAGTGIDAFNYWAGEGTSLITEKELQKLIDNYIEKAAAALTGSRFSPSRGTWSVKGSPSVFDESALIMAATESIGKSSYRRIMDQLDLAAASHSKDLSIYSSPLFGNIVNEGWAYAEDMKLKITTLRRKADAGDYSVFSDPELITALIAEDSGTLGQQIQEMTDTAADRELTTEQAVSVLKFYADITSRYPETQFQFEKCLDVIESIVLPQLRIFDNRVYISDNDNRADIRQTLLAGVLLKQCRKGEDIDSVGRELVNSALLLSDESGFLPQHLSFPEGADARQEGSLKPETLYPLLTGNQYYPGIDYYLSDTGEKLAVINQAGYFRIEKTDFGYRMRFSFPAGQTHMFAVRNLKPFYQMNLLGYRWNSDHRFLTYSSGWWFDRQHNTLYVKIRHRTEEEEILIYTQQPPAAPVPAVETPAEGTDTQPQETGEQPETGSTAAPADENGQNPGDEGL